MSTSTDEQVLVVPASDVHETLQGFSSDPSHFPQISQMEFRPRSAMEVDPSWKQLIPYVAVHHVSEDGEVSVLSYRRGGSGSEGRLHGNWSIGVGGHICEEDEAEGGAPDTYAAGMMRELTEELRIVSPFRQEAIGVLYDPSNEVGRVHLGMIHLLLVETQMVFPREDCIADMRFRPIDQVAEHILDYETWSQILIRHLYGGGPIHNHLRLIRRLPLQEMAG